MKKILTLFLIPLLLISCSKKTNPIIYDGEFLLSEKYYTEIDKGLKDDIDYSLIKQALDNKESFVVFIYSNGCMTCASFKPILEDFLNQHNMQFLASTFQLMKDNVTAINDYVKYTPGLVIFNNGDYVVDLDANEEEDTYAFKSLNGFTEWFSRFVIIKM